MRVGRHRQVFASVGKAGQDDREWTHFDLFDFCERCQLGLQRCNRLCERLGGVDEDECDGEGKGIAMGWMRDECIGEHG